MNFRPFNMLVPAGGLVSAHPVVTARFRLGLGVLAAPRSIGTDSARPCAWLGRCRVGGDMMLRLQTVGIGTFSQSGLTWPDAVPVARIYCDVTPSLVQVQNVPIDDSSGGSVGIFRGRYVPGPVNVPGRYFVLYQYLTTGRTRCQLAPFEVIPGGHPSGHVQSMFSFDLPAGSVFIAHQGSGRVTTGLRPYMDQGD